MIVYWLHYKNIDEQGQAQQDWALGNDQAVLSADLMVAGPQASAVWGGRSTEELVIQHTIAEDQARQPHINIKRHPKLTNTQDEEAGLRSYRLQQIHETIKSPATEEDQSPQSHVPLLNPIRKTNHHEAQMTLSYPARPWLYLFLPLYIIAYQNGIFFFFMP